MRGRYKELNWEGAGYHGFPASPGQDDYVSAEDAAIWRGFEEVLEAAKQGDFSKAGKLLTIYDETDSWMLGAACSELLGDIGSRPLFETIRPAVESILEPTYSVDLGRTLAIWGHLSVVPTLTNTLKAVAKFVDAPALVQMLSLLLEPEPGPLADTDELEDADRYALLVRTRASEVAAQIGREDAVVLFGELFSVARLVERMTSALEGGSFDPYFRHKFEATTGIDCTSFYSNEIIQPLAISALLEDFVDRGGPDDYVPGRRYFFGHPIPD